MPDACNDRKCSEKECPSLINRPLSDEQLFSREAGRPDWKLLRDFLSREGPLTKAQTVHLL